MLVNVLGQEALYALYLRETGSNTFPDFEVSHIREEATEDSWQPLQFEVVECCKQGGETYSHYVSILDIVAWSVSRSVATHEVANLKNTIVLECDSSETQEDVAKLLTDVAGVHVATTAGEEGSSMHDNYGLGLCSTPVSANHTKVKRDS